jgi:hypothetical protein
MNYNSWTELCCMLGPAEDLWLEAAQAANPGEPEPKALHFVRAHFKDFMEWSSFYAMWRSSQPHDHGNRQPSRLRNRWALSLLLDSCHILLQQGANHALIRNVQTCSFGLEKIDTFLVECDGYFPPGIFEDKLIRARQEVIDDNEFSIVNFTKLKRIIFIGRRLARQPWRIFL